MITQMIREHIKQSGDSLNMVARKVGVSREAVGYWVNGGREPSKLSIRKVCRGLGWDEKTEARLLGMTDEKPNFKRNTLTDEFWELMWDLERDFPASLRDVPENDERLVRIREIVGAKPHRSTMAYDKRKVEELRIEQGYHGYQIGELMGYSKSWYNGTFRESKKFPDFHARRLAEIFGVEVNDLVREDA